MKRSINLCERTSLIRLVLVIILSIFMAVPASTCTIFVLADGRRVLFYNNEDWLNPKTRIWFVPAGEGHYGCAYVGFDDGFAQGGLNTKGLAFDWVAGFMEQWVSYPDMKNVRGNSSERMLESCATVEEAITFYQTHREPDFSRAKILVADSTGVSVIIGAKNVKLRIEKLNQSRGFGYGSQILENMLANPPEPTVSNGATILRACIQKGRTPTQYSNVFDLKSGDIYLFRFQERDDSVKLNLAVELEKGGHYYEIPQIRQQFAQPPLPLLNNMKRFFLDEFQPITDTEPDVTKHIRAIILDAMGGNMRPEDYNTELWGEFSSAQKEIQADLKRYGNFVSIALVERRIEKGKRCYLYRVEFNKLTCLMRYVLDEQNKIALMRSEGAEWKPGADLGE